jgi:alkaline phosphatase
MRTLYRSVSLSLAAAVLLGCASAYGATNVTLTPPEGARFLAHQRFDIRVEGKGTGNYSAKLWIDGQPVEFTSGVQNTTTTDGISLAGWGGFNHRGYSLPRDGVHTLKAEFTDDGGTTTVTSKVQVVDPFRSGKGKKGDLRVTKNVVILLGDGMGMAHRSAARIVRYGATAGQPDGRLAMEKFPGTGWVSTHSLNSIVTDSAPGMSCYVSGNHNANGQEGVFPANVTSAFYAPRIEYLSEYLHRVKGTSLGLVTTADVEDATPAANAVHTKDRGLGTGIVDQYLDESDAADTGKFGTGLRVLLGGGRRWFVPTGTTYSSRALEVDKQSQPVYQGLPADVVAGWELPAQPASQGKPTRDLLADFQAAGFKYAATKTDLDNLTRGRAPKRLLGLFGYGNMNVAMDKLAKRRNVPVDGGSSYVVDDYHAPDQPMLDEMAEAAFQVLSRNEDGFVLMIEGAHIDKQSHLMDADRAILETLEFDRAVGVARKWADKLGDTTVLVLADHECSGFSLIGALTGGIKNLKQLPSDASNVTPDPAFKSAPKRQAAVGTYDAAGFPRYNILADGYPETMNVDSKVLVGFGANGDRYETWLTKPLPVIDSLLPSGIKAELGTAGYSGAPLTRSIDANGFFLRGHVSGDQAVHTASDIPVSAYSSCSNAWTRYVGAYANTDVFFQLASSTLSGDDPAECRSH